MEKSDEGQLGGRRLPLRTGGGVRSDIAELALLPFVQLVNAINQREDSWILGAKQVRCDGRRTSRDGFYGGAPSSTTVEHVQVRAVAHPQTSDSDG
jgi:hypothetical protein